MSQLADAVADIREYLPIAAALIAEPDTAPAGPGGKPRSRPPWNQQNAAAVYDTVAMVSATEVLFRRLVTGHGERKPAAATGRALAAIESLGHAVPHDHAKAAARDLFRCVQVIRLLPAIDEEERWERLRTGADGQRPCCPHCQTPNLRVAPRAGLVACVLPGCADGDGNRPVASMTLGTVSGAPMVVGADGAIWAVAP